MQSRSIVAANLALLGGCIGYRTPLDDPPRFDAGIPCAPGGVGLTHAEPTVMFVLDRSGSMDTVMDPTRNSPTRWQALGSALGSALPSVDSAMAVGALLFPAVGGGSSSCSVAGRADLQPAVGNVATLVRLMGSSPPGGSTPTASAVDTAAQLMLGLRTATDARALVLATDGEPNCNSLLSTRTCRCTTGTTAGATTCSSGLRCLDDTRTEEIIAKYESRGLPTYVVGIQSQGDTQFVDVLNAMAIAGGRPRTGATESYYAANSEPELNAALGAIRDQVGACTYLTTSVPDPNGSIVISLDGSEVPPEQWSWGNKANGEIVLIGDACQTAAARNNPTLTAVVQCNEGG